MVVVAEVAVENAAEVASANKAEEFEVAEVKGGEGGGSGDG